MKKYFALFTAFALVLSFAGSASAQILFKDVPDDHWAAEAVYNLIKLGVTRGYPDGTFRGSQNITRYETAMLIANLAEALKDVGTEELKADIEALKREVAVLKVPKKKGLELSGGVEASWKFANIFTEKGSERGSIANYRLKLSAAHEVNDMADVKVNLDTMDYGFMDDTMTNTGGILAQELVDVESNVKLDMSALGMENPVNLKVTYGPGNKRHMIDPTGTIPSEQYVTYMRPYPAAIASTNIMGMDISGGYIAQGHANTGRVTASQLTGSAGYMFEDVPMIEAVKITGTADYISEGQFSSEEGERDIRGSVAVEAALTDKIETSGIWRLGGSEKEYWAVSGDLTLNDVWDTGTVAVIRASKVGTDFVTDRFADVEWDFAGFDTFDRPLIEGTVNIGGEISQTVMENVKLIGKGDVRLAGDFDYEDDLGRFTAEGGVSYAVAPNATLDAIYRVHQSKAGGGTDSTDIAAFGLMYNF